MKTSRLAAKNGSLAPKPYGHQFKTTLQSGAVAQSDNPQNLTDKNLYSLCKMYGVQALQARRKFAGLLPEVFKRGLFEKRSFHSIYEFAAKLCGMSREQVDVVLRLERKFQNMPLLHGLLVRGEVSHNKLLRVASIATPENEAVPA